MALPQVLTALRSSRFRWLWLAGVISGVGDFAHSVAESWLIFELTGSAIGVGLVMSLFALPMAVLMLFGGVLADMIERRRILIAVMAARMAMVGVVALLTFQGLVQPWHIYVLAFGMGTTLAFSIPAFQALVPSLVHRDAVRSAYALQSTSLNVASALGRGLGGVMVAALGVAVTFTFNAATYLAPLLYYLLLRLPPQPTRGLSWRGTWRDLREGLGFVAEQRRLFSAVLIIGATLSVSFPLVMQAPVFAVRALGEGAAAAGFLMGAWFAGMVAGSLAGGEIGGRFDPLRFLVSTGVLAAAALVAYGLAPNLPIALLACFVGGALTSAMLVVQSAFIVGTTPGELRGRVMSVAMLAQAGPVPLTNLLIGFLAELVGIRWAIIGFSVLLGLAVCITPRPRAPRSTGVSHAGVG